jgi:hypothetical protein
MEKEEELLLSNIELKERESSESNLLNSERAEKDNDLQRKRWEDAKNLLNGYLDKFKKPKVVNEC